MVGNAKITPRPQLNGFGFEDVLDVGKSIFDEWVSGKGETEEKALLQAQVEAQKAQSAQLLNIVQYGLIAVAIVFGVKYVSGR